MTGDVIPLHGDPHRDVLTLLPWYAKGLLDDKDRAAVDIHLRTCPACQAELTEETRLQSVLTLASIPSEIPADVDLGWQVMQRRVSMQPDRQRDNAGTRAMTWPGTWAGIRRQWQSGAPWLRWTVAAQFALLALFGGLALKPHQPPAHYQTMSAKTAPVTANIIVMFRPEASEQDLRRILKSCDARVIDGPTAADAYMLRVPANRRTAIVAKLKQQSEITLAQPVDAGWVP